jgi:DNA-directed RNA polymerase subunit B'
MTDIIYNGRFVGSTENPQDLMIKLKEKRRMNELPIELSVRYQQSRDCIFLTTETGRIIRPLVIVKNGEPMLKQEHINLLKEGKLTFTDLVKQGIIEYLDAAEEDNALIALTEKDITPDHTHMEVDSIAMLGLITSLVPYSNHDHSSRLNRGSKTQKQALGLYSAAYPIRLDTDVSILQYPQKPLVRSFVYDTVPFYPAGQNVIVAIMPFEGYNVEDAIILNKGSVQRGFGRSSYFRPYTTIESQYPGGLSDQICIPSKDISGYRTEKTYQYLEEDGIVSPEAKMIGGEVVIGKTSPPKFLSDMGEMSMAKARKENSITLRQEEEAIIDAVFITQDNQGNRVIQVRSRDPRSLEPGDKLSTPHGQKGVVGILIPESEIPFTARGVKPDILFNPHSIPSRMTVGYLMELLAGKTAALSAKKIDATPFIEHDMDSLEKMLIEMGFRADGKETMYSGISGRKMEAKIYIGNMYYLKLKYMVANKIHARAFGKVTLLTRQPVEGRSKGGALRLGEMEKDAIVGHGAALLLKERYDSDKIVVHVCEKCGSLAVIDKIRKKEACPLCTNSKIEPVEISYAFKLLMEELMTLLVFPRLILKNKYE